MSGQNDYVGPGDYKTGVGLFRDEDVAQDEIIRDRKKLEERKIIIIHTEMLKKFDFKNLKIEKMILDPKEVGLNQNYFGGQCKRCAILKDSPFIVILNATNQTIGLHLPKEKELLAQLGHRELLDIAKRQGLKANTKTKKEDLVDILTNM